MGSVAAYLPLCQQQNLLRQLNKLALRELISPKPFIPFFSVVMVLRVSAAAAEAKPCPILTLWPAVSQAAQPSHNTTSPKSYHTRNIPCCFLERNNKTRTSAIELHVNWVISTCPEVQMGSQHEEVIWWSSPMQKRPMEVALVLFAKNWWFILWNILMQPTITLPHDGKKPLLPMKWSVLPRKQEPSHTHKWLKRVPAATRASPAPATRVKAARSPLRGAWCSSLVRKWCNFPSAKRSSRQQFPIKEEND